MPKLPTDIRLQVANRGSVQTLPCNEAIQEAELLSVETNQIVWMYDAVTGKLAGSARDGRVKAVRS